MGGPLLVLAGAGSGKTRVITRKIAHLITECGLKPSHIAAVTFTNKAAREMRARVGGLLEKSRSRGLRVCTFHTLGLDILRREGRELGLYKTFSIFDAHDSQQLIRELLRKADSGEADAEARAVQWQISKWKNDMLGPDQALSGAGTDEEVRAARLFGAYQRQLRSYKAFDFDDLITEPLHLFREHPEALERWQNRLRYLLVDEYQDTNAAQYELLRALTGPRAAFTVVGDDDQSIYAWRGARPENLARLGQDYPQLRVVKLEQNYRSTLGILNCANRLIGNNPHLFEKQLWSQLGPGDAIRVIECPDGDEEARRVVAELIGHKFQHNNSFGDYAILYRSNHQSRPFERELREHRIPYRVSGGQSFFAAAEVKDALSYLRLLANPDDDAALLRIINTPRREIGPGTLETLSAYAAERGVSLLEASFEMGLEQRLSPRALRRLQAFTRQAVESADNAARGDAIGVYRELLEKVDYRGWLQDQSNDARAADRRWGNVQELLGWLERLAQKELKDPELPDLVAHLTLMDVLERNNEEQTGDQVSLLTLHAAKGLEYPHVFMVGMEEDTLPHRNSQEEEQIQEERRLAYVGITRAQRSLSLTLARRRLQGGEAVEMTPSRFLEELPEDLIEWPGRAGRQLPPEQRKQRGQAHLAALKGMLGS